jgi:hypothetical protein
MNINTAEAIRDLLFEVDEPTLFPIEPKPKVKVKKAKKLIKRTIKPEEPELYGGRPVLVVPFHRGGQSYFCKHNPEINRFAASGSTEMAAVLLFCIASQQLDWATLHEMFPKLIADLMAGKTDMAYPEGDPMRAMLVGKFDYIRYIWYNRKKLYSGIRACGNDEVKMYFYIKDNVKGLGTIKSAFAVQLILGKLGCIDNVNQKIFGKGARELSGSSLKKAQEYLQMLQGIEASYGPGYSGKLWDDWCDIVAHRLKATLAGQPPKLLVRTLLKGATPGQDVEVALRPYMKRGFVKDYYQAMKERPGGVTGGIISGQHVSTITKGFGEEKETMEKTIRDIVFETMPSRCPVCGGAGISHDGTPCENCDGTGRVMQQDWEHHRKGTKKKKKRFIESREDFYDYKKFRDEQVREARRLKRDRVRKDPDL